LRAGASYKKPHSIAARPPNRACDPPGGAAKVRSSKIAADLGVCGKFCERLCSLAQSAGKSMDSNLKKV